MPSIAVVIPLYNHADFIETAIASVWTQTHPPDRLIVVDDGSTDGSADQVEKLADSRLQLIRQSNQGAHAALNRGIALAEGCDWIAILNSDDFFAPERLARCLEVLEQRPGTEMLCTDLHLVDDQGKPLPKNSSKARRLVDVWELALAEPDPLLALGISNFAKTTSNLVASRRLLLAHPFAPYRYVHDYHAILCAALAGKFSILPEDLLSYRSHGNNTIKSSGKSVVVLETLQMNLDLLASHARILRQSQELRSRYRQYLQRLLGNHTDFRGELLVQLLAEAIVSHPELFTAAPLQNLPELEEPSAGLPLPPVPHPVAPEEPTSRFSRLLRSTN